MFEAPQTKVEAAIEARQKFCALIKRAQEPLPPTHPKILKLVYLANGQYGLESVESRIAALLSEIRSLCIPGVNMAKLAAMAQHQWKVEKEALENGQLPQEKVSLPS